MANKLLSIICHELVIVWIILWTSSKCYSQSPSDWYPQKVEYSYPEVSIVDSNLITIIERFVLQDSCDYLQEYPNGYLDLIIKTTPSGYSITIAYINNLRLYDYYGLNKHIGYFYINNKLCLIGGSILLPFFAPQENTKIFSTYMHPFPPIEEFPTWVIEYSKGEYTLLFKDCL